MYHLILSALCALPSFARPSTIVPPDLAERDLSGDFDLSWQSQAQTLFSADWSYAPPNIGVGGSISGDHSLSLECIDCRTYGTIVASIGDDAVEDGFGASLTFNGVGGYFDFGVHSAGTGTFSYGINGDFGTPNKTGNGLSASFTLQMGLVLQMSAEIEASGGFQFTIPDGSKVELQFIASIFPELDIEAKLSSVPDVTFGLLPVMISSTETNITAALRVGIGADISGTIAAQTYSASAGAYVNLVEVKLGQTSNAPDGKCSRSVFGEINANAGAFAALNDGDTLQPSMPTISTIFLAASTSTCMDGREGIFVSTSAPSQPTPTNCPSALAVQETEITSTYSLTACLVSAMNCPRSLSQVVVVTNVEKVSTTNCPVAAATAAAVILPAAAPITSPLTVQRLAIPVSQSLSISTVNPAPDPTITGSYVPIRVKPTPTPTPDPESSNGGVSSQFAWKPIMLLTLVVSMAVTLS